MKVAIGFGFPSHWLINWREVFKPIAKRSNCSHVITFDGHLKTALSGHNQLRALLKKKEQKSRVSSFAFIHCVPRSIPGVAVIIYGL